VDKPPEKTSTKKDVSAGVKPEAVVESSNTKDFEEDCPCLGDVPSEL
jgi:hypothetical protein